MWGAAPVPLVPIGGMDALYWQIYASYLPLNYVLLFPDGEPGWHQGRTLYKCQGNSQNRDLSQCTFYHFCLHTRPNELSTLFRAQRLFEQFVVDGWAVCDQNKLSWIRSHRANILADLQSGLADALVAGNTDLNCIGKRVVLCRVMWEEIDLCNSFTRTVWLLYVTLANLRFS